MPTDIYYFYLIEDGVLITTAAFLYEKDSDEFAIKYLLENYPESFEEGAKPTTFEELVDSFLDGDDSITWDIMIEPLHQSVESAVKAQ